jgi:hypothetical protein
MKKVLLVLAAALLIAGACRKKDAGVRMDMEAEKTASEPVQALDAAASMDAAFGNTASAPAQSADQPEEQPLAAPRKRALDAAARMNEAF